MALIRHAASQRWPIPEDRRAAISSMLADMAVAGAGERSRLGAARTLAAMDRLNQRQEQYDEARPEVHRIEITAPAADAAAVRLAQWRQMQQQAISQFLTTLHSPSGAPIMTLPTPTSSTTEPAS